MYPIGVNNWYSLWYNNLYIAILQPASVGGVTLDNNELYAISYQYNMSIPN